MRKVFSLLVFCFLTTLFSVEEEVAYLCDDQMQCVPPSEEEEYQLFSQINSESRRLYNSLDCEGKKRALILSDQYDNKNQAVQVAAKEMGKRQLFEYEEMPTYRQRQKNKGGQKPFNRYGS